MVQRSWYNVGAEGGNVTLERPWCFLHGSFRWVLSLDISLASGGRPPGLNPLWRGWVYRPAPEAHRKRECRRGLRHFWNCLTHVGFSSATEPTLKIALCHIRTLSRMINTVKHRFYVTSVWFSNHTWSEAMHNMSAHQLPQYF